MGQSSAVGKSSLCQRVDLLVGRKTAERLLGELQLAVDRDLEHAAARADQLDFGVDQLVESCPRTEGSRLVASSAAIVDDDFHGNLFRQKLQSGQLI
jgi:hypothetical protein